MSWPILLQCPLNKFRNLKDFCSTTGRMQGVKGKTVASCLLGLFKYTSIDLKHSSMISLIGIGLLAHFGTVQYPLKGFCSTTSRTQDTAQKTFAIC